MNETQVQEASSDYHHRVFSSLPHPTRGRGPSLIGQGQNGGGEGGGIKSKRKQETSQPIRAGLDAPREPRIIRDLLPRR